VERLKYGPENPDITYIQHQYEEHLFDTGDAILNYATTGSPDKPAIVLVPGQTESWWGYEKAMGLLSENFQVFAIDLRGQGRSSRTPGRYTFDNFGNDLVKFIAFMVKKPVVVSGLSSGGVISAWLLAYAPPGLIRGAHYEDPPLFACERTPAFGPGIRQATLRTFDLFNTYLGDQWRVGDWEGLKKAVREEFPASFQMVFETYYPMGSEPPQNLKEYDPEWAKAFVTGSVGASCDHARMLSKVKCPVLFTHHFSRVDEKTGHLMGASTVRQVDQVERLVKQAGQPFTRLSFPKMGHNLHDQDPELFVRTLVEWEKTLPTEKEIKRKGVFSESG
jgi:pimeloyl-ACP methyl ester carboxylesterase